MSPTQVSFTQYPDLVGERVGGQALAANDDFFAPKENLTKFAPAIFIPDKYTELGKWMDGWESRRKRGPGHDWCVLKLGVPGVLHGVNVDTAHFLGNYPEYCSLDGAIAAEGASLDSLKWKEILPKSPLQGGTENLFALSDAGRFTHVRLNIYPDGGVARLRVHGEPKPDWTVLKAKGGLIDLAALEHGGRALAANDKFFSHPDNLVLPGRAKTMGEGWETRRRRGPGNDWAILRLGTAGRIRRIEVDTNHYKGNFPESCSIEACRFTGAKDPLPCDFRDGKDFQWEELLPRTPLKADHRHLFEAELKKAATEKSFDLVRLQIYPDGGVSRLRVFGEPA
jgi:allantoicase